MTNRKKQASRTAKRQWWQCSPLILMALLLVWSLGWGWGLSLVTHAALRSPSLNPPSATSPSIPDAAIVAQAVDNSTLTDPVPANLQLGQELYLQTCASCHVPIPPAVLPSETWRQLIQDPQHYGVTIQPPLNPSKLLVWNYLRNFSRAQLDGEAIPYRLEQSRLFRALHPKVNLPRPIRVSGCASCHPGAAQYNFRGLTPEWENAP